MNRFLIPTVWLLVIVCMLVFVIDKPSVGADKVEPVKAVQPKATSSKVTRMQAKGKVIEVTATTLKIERTLKNKGLSSETMEFILEKPVNVEPGAKVYVSYIKKDDKLLAMRVTNISKRKKPDLKSGKTAEQKDISGGTKVK